MEATNQPQLVQSSEAKEAPVAGNTCLNEDKTPVEETEELKLLLPEFDNIFLKALKSRTVEPEYATQAKIALYKRYIPFLTQYYLLRFVNSDRPPGQTNSNVVAFHGDEYVTLDRVNDRELVFRENQARPINTQKEDDVRILDLVIGFRDRPDLFSNNNLLSLGESIEHYICKQASDTPYKIYIAYNRPQGTLGARYVINLRWGTTEQVPEALVPAKKYISIHDRPKYGYNHVGYPSKTKFTDRSGRGQRGRGRGRGRGGRGRGHSEN